MSDRRKDREIPQLKELEAHLDVETIIEEAAEHFKVTADRIVTSGSKRNIERDVAIYLARELSGLSCQALGRYFGGVSGANITMWSNRVSHDLQKDRKLTKSVKLLRRKIRNN